VRAGAGNGGEVRSGRRAARDAVACAREGSREEEQGRGRGRTTRGVHPSRRWRGDGGRAAARGEGLPAAGGQSRQHVPEEEEERRESGGPVCENQKLQGPHGKERFPTDLEVF
jgi:hypothetical protein